MRIGQTIRSFAPLFTLFGCALLLATQTGGGCTYDDAPQTSGETEAVPHGARAVREGDGDLGFTPRSDGRVWAYDADDRVVLDARRVRSGQEYAIAPDSNRILLDGKKVYDQDIKKKHFHRIYFQSDDRRDDRYDDRDRRGGNNGGESRLPRTAKRVADGRGDLSYTARDDGRAYVYDEDDDRILADFRIRDGQTLRIDPDKDTITLNGKGVFNGNLEKKHSHRIYFDRD